MKITILFNLLVAFSSVTVWAWGGRGHDTICEVATFLVEEPGLREFLKSRPHTMGHLCNIPDIQWRSLDSKARSAGDPTHYIEPDILGLLPKDTPTDLKKLQSDWNGKARVDDPTKKIFSLTRDMGSLWWRVDQFMRMIADLKEPFAKSPPPANKSEEQNDTLAFNQHTYQFLTYAGIMGHFVGDAANPYHNTIDYDGWKSGRGGIHAYYEELSVAEMPHDLNAKIKTAAGRFKKAGWKNSKLTALEKMRLFSQVSFEELSKTAKLDPIIKKSELKIENGMSLKTQAERKPAKFGSQQFEPIIVSQMARASVLLAHLWDEAYKSMGKPELGNYKSYKYPLTVDFVFPDYEDLPNNPK